MNMKTKQVIGGIKIYSSVQNFNLTTNPTATITNNLISPYVGKKSTDFTATW